MLQKNRIVKTYVLSQIVIKLQLLKNLDLTLIKKEI